MRLEISSELLRQAEAAALAAHPFEACGLLLGHEDKVIELVVARNVALTPQTHFEVDPAALIAAHRAARTGGAQVLGNWHSHPMGLARPSAEDARSAAPDGQFWLILGQNQAHCWRAVESGLLHGRFEPVALAVV